MKASAAEAEEPTAALGKREAEIRQEAKTLEAAHSDLANQVDRARKTERALKAREQELGTRTGELEEARATLARSEEHTSELQSRQYLVCRLLLEKKKEIDEGTG